MAASILCPACGHTNQSTHRHCAHCGAALHTPADGQTMTSPHPSSPPPQRTTSDGARFLPGQVLAGRYRMIGLLGKGGMGEVYRADDLKLGQPVALKFLPRDVEGDPQRLERFLTEVRMSLRVTHPNVCRVFDLGELEGRHFLSMEYVDGEDLGSLLRRIGRLPEDKAVEIARQMCAGLAAAHDEGVLHRDLKPANVMIDGRGRAKITDFGLAGATVGIAGLEARSGTPQYMAPEQFEGRELSVQTDLYSLGLVLYELFTGKRAFDSRDLAELAAQRTSTPTSPSAHVAGLNPVVECAILRCLDPDPARRPKSASSLAAALPGGDPLAMAIAAGETPSPEMVARAGGRGELKPVVAGICLASVIVGLGAIWFAYGIDALANRVPMPKPPEELRVAARAAIVAAGYTFTPASRAFGFQRDGSYFSSKAATEDRSPGRWDNLATVTPAPIWFWYRESTRPMSPTASIGSIGVENPPMDQPGMVRVSLDPAGRLQELQVVPPDLPAVAGPWAEPDWTPIFSSAGFALADWKSADPLWAPPHATDVRRAWTRDTLRIEAGAFRGRPVWFRVVPPWRRANNDTPASPPVSTRVLAVALQMLMVGVVLGAAAIARRNIRQGRSDRRGALRLAVIYVAAGTATDVLRLSGDASDWFETAVNGLALQMISGVLVWLFYVAIEPYVRRLWPNTLIAWTRALDGQFRDPLVGRHILLGAISGLAFVAIGFLPLVSSRWLGLPPDAPTGGLDVLTDTGRRIGSFFFILQDSLFIPVVALLAVLIFRVILRRPWLAYLTMFTLVFGFLAIAQAPWMIAARVILVVALSVLVLTRLGLFAFLVGITFSSWGGLSLTTDPSSWFFGWSVITMLVFVGVAVYGFWVSLGGQALFKDSVLGDR